jgi:hypothetical protein
MSASELISNLQAAIESQEAAEQAAEDWQHEFDRNEAALALAMERRPFLLAEKVKRDHDLSEGRKDVAAAHAAVSRFCRLPEEAAPLPASPAPAELPESPSAPAAPKKRMSKADRRAWEQSLTPEVRRQLRLEHKQEAEHKRATRSPEEQAKIDARIAKMRATQAAKKLSPVPPPAAEAAEESV